MHLLTRTGADGMLPGRHTIIRGLAPQAGGFRRRSNRQCGRDLSACPISAHERLPCVLQVVPPPAAPYHTSVRVRLSTPNNDPVARNAQYITNRMSTGGDNKRTTTRGGLACRGRMVKCAAGGGGDGGGVGGEWVGTGCRALGASSGESFLMFYKTAKMTTGGETKAKF